MKLLASALIVVGLAACGSAPAQHGAPTANTPKATYTLGTYVAKTAADYRHCEAEKQYAVCEYFGKL